MVAYQASAAYCCWCGYYCACHHCHHRWLAVVAIALLCGGEQSCVLCTSSVSEATLSYTHYQSLQLASVTRMISDESMVSNMVTNLEDNSAALQIIKLKLDQGLNLG